ncbi:MAG: hypothetical protein R3D70_09435 [Rhizobiaceae bacterium]
MIEGNRFANRMKNNGEEGDQDLIPGNQATERNSVSESADELSPQAKWNREHPFELFTHQIVRSALKRGFIEKGPCSVEGCSDRETEAHHEDYSRPLAVTWFCRKHHQQHHAALRAAARDGASEEAA